MSKKRKSSPSRIGFALAAILCKYSETSESIDYDYHSTFDGVIMESFADLEVMVTIYFGLTPWCSVVKHVD